MDRERLKYLFERHIEKTCTDSEKQELAVWGLVPEKQEEIIALFEKVWEEIPVHSDIPEDQADRIFDNLLAASGVKVKPKVIRISFRKITVAASVLFVLSLAAYWTFFNGKTNKQDGTVKAATVKDVDAPATNRAMITLADGRMVYLDSAGNGELAVQGNVKLVKLTNGQIAYETTSGEVLTEMKYNTLSNPRGSKVIDMALADGSHVWLNAGSSVTYPIAFIGNERNVSVTGEAYFEVTHDKTKPFKVSKGDMSVEVLGTRFNVNAYDDEESIQVTLLEGSVEVKNQKSKVKIVPGQQAVIMNNQRLTVNKGVDLEQVMAWKNGSFYFNQAGIAEVMRQLSRWYDVKVQYEGKMPASKFGGEMGRDLSLSQVLRLLEKNEVHFRLEEKTVTVLP